MASRKHGVAPPRRTRSKGSSRRSVLETSIADRISRLSASLGGPFSTDPRVALYASALEASDATALSRRPERAPKEEFLARADAFLAAHEIALAIISKRYVHGDWGDVTSRASMLFNVESIRRGHVRTTSRLKYLETAFFTEWNEGPLSETKEFWEAVRLAGLPYARRDLLGEIFARGRIASREHYEFAIDVIGIAEDEGLLSSHQVEQLGRWIGAYEQR